jgi:signal peptidase II
VELWIAAVVIVLDQATKAIVRATFDLHESVTVVPGFFDLTRVHNTGAAFGLFNAADFPFKPAVLIVVALAALAVVDFFDFYWRGWHFWAFNVADAAITVGVSLMILDFLGLGHRVSRAV